MLDPKGRQEVMDTIRHLNKSMGITIVLITHYMDEAVQADRVIVMDKGSILTQGTPRQVFSKTELLKEHSLDVPQSVELMYTLKNRYGAAVNEMPLTPAECVQTLSEILPQC